MKARMNAAGLALMALAPLAPACVPVARGGSAAEGPLGPRTVLVELYTSQGCSSCPAADAFVRDFPRLGLDRAHVVPLTFHVDYWDDLGWKDPFASPAFTERQRRYAQPGRLRSPDGADGLQGIYTPQMIVDGAVHFSGGQRAVALREIRKASVEPAALEIAADAAVQGARVTVTVRLEPRASDAFQRPLRVQVALASRGARTAVTRGENSGATLEEAAVVRALSAPTPVTSRPAAPLAITVAKPPSEPWSAVELAVIVADEATGHVVAVRAVAVPGA
ncbi:MAG TPA: DUF1223 domain-containing protein [Polyangia bacterium]|nr:DUF1223 domain-containing protein [Polyangia bacterium]